VIALLHKDWAYGGKTYAAGSLIAYDAATLVVGRPAAVEQVYVPTGKQAIEAVVAGSGRLYVSLLEDVAGRLIALTPSAAGWTAETVPVPPNSTVTLAAAGGANDTAFYTTESFASPETLMAVRGGSAPTEVAALRAFFDPASISVEQRFATSKDGTRIPYFVVRPAGAKGPLPTIMHAYGGFRSAQKPTYLTKNPYQIGPGGLFWLKDGGSFVIANIRGGGEYGPAWHEAALREKRQNSFDDLYAVAEDLKRAGLTSKLAVSGRSQGGMLVGVAMTQRPDLFDAVIMGVPLADMLRYNKLLAGASWMGEYGNPDVAADRAFIAKYSPYQNLRAGAKYPPVIIYTSTKDDRVHPGHARKYAARLAQQGHAFDYYENIEGGHAGAANAAEHAYRAALMLSFARRALMGK
jgi:prolyl oligopeptidase